jgi:aspartyl-tRNA(Asn)/glutamyl-tRNA(Gln) amidotransferase subunit B
MSDHSKLVHGYEVVIGLETHVQLQTKSKQFSGASTQFGAAPNSQACAVDLALPGVLPVMNAASVDHAIAFGLAVGATINRHSTFERKNYFYPDLPKGYQISQYLTPIVQGGTVSFFVDGQEHSVRLVRAHLEEDAGKSLHENLDGMSGIDLNRAGTPLLEIVTEPDMRSSKEAAEYARALHALVVWLGICDGNLQEGSFRCDANVSVRKPGAPLGTRREIKNLNSFKFIQQAIDAEVRWQIETIEDGGRIEQATVLFDEGSGETRAMRSKEDAHDYRYFPDPDLPPLVVDEARIERVKAAMPELPAAMAERFARDYKLPAYDAQVMTQSKAFAAYFERCARALPGNEKLAANWLMGEVSRRLNAEEKTIESCTVPPSALARIIAQLLNGTVNALGAKQLFDELWTNQSAAQVAASVNDIDADPERYLDSVIENLIDAKGLKQISDTGALEKIIDAVIAGNAKSVEEFRAGKQKAFQALVGQAMKATQGKANPQQVNELLRKKLGA